MPHVTVTINGKAYRMACDDGQERHLLDLAERFDGYVNHLRGAFGEIGDQRLTVMAGVMVTDELQELEKRLRSLEADVAILKASRDQQASAVMASESELGRQLVAAAERVESFARRLSATRRDQ